MGGVNLSTAEVASDEDALRAHWYGVLARFLARPPAADLLDLAKSFEGDDTELGRALSTLGRTAAGTGAQQASEEYHALFYGMGRGELVPHGSYYLTGFLNEKPLAVLRADLDRLGVARATDVPEPEDHIAALCETMAGLISGAFESPVSLAGQRDFFNVHLRPWVEKFFEDLEGAQSSALYMPVGTIGRVFMRIEAEAFDMVA